MRFGRQIGRVLAVIQIVLLIVIFVSVEAENNLVIHTQLSVLYILSIILLALSILCFLVTIYYFRQPITPNPFPLEKSTLRTNGIYSLVRHPMYLSAFLFIAGYVLYRSTYFTLLLCVPVMVFLLVKISWEEKFLSLKFEDYEQYRKRTKKIVPFIY